MPHTVYRMLLLKPDVVTLKKAESKQEKNMIFLFCTNYKVLYVGQTWAKEPSIQYVY